MVRNRPAAVPAEFTRIGVSGTSCRFTRFAGTGHRGGNRTTRHAGEACLNLQGEPRIGILVVGGMGKDRPLVQGTVIV